MDAVPPLGRDASVEGLELLKLGARAILIAVVRAVEHRFGLEKNVLIETARRFGFFHALRFIHWICPPGEPRRGEVCFRQKPAGAPSEFSPLPVTEAPRRSPEVD